MMATNSKNIWWDKSITLVEGCTPISVGCEHCWSAGMAHRFRKSPGLTKKGSFVGKIVCREDRLGEMRKRKKPTRWTIWNDLFHEKVSDSFICKVFKQTYQARQHIYLILTKRAERMQRFFENCVDRIGFEEDFQHIHLGVTVCCQDEEYKIRHLIQTPAAVRFISVEPMLGPLEIAPYLRWRWKDLTENKLLSDENAASADELFEKAGFGAVDTHLPIKGKLAVPDIDGVICGCESGPRRRPTKIEWIRSLRDQCVEAGVPFFLKQMEIKGKVVKMPELDGKVWAELPGVKQ